MFDFAKVVNFLPFTKFFFANIFAFIIIFSFYLDYIGARLHLCSSLSTMAQSSPTTADHLATVQASTAATDTHPTREPTTDRHTLDRFRASDGAHPRPVWITSRPALRTLSPSRAHPLPPWGVRGHKPC